MNYAFKPGASDRRVRALLILSALILILEGGIILAVANPKPQTERAEAGVGGLYGLPAQGPQAAGKAPDLRRGLDLDKLRRLSPEEAYYAALAWARETATGGPLTDKDVAGILPPASFFLARTSSDADVDDIREAAAGSGAFARAYQALDRAIPGSNAAGLRVEAALEAIRNFRAAEAGTAPSTVRPEPLQLPVSPGRRWIAPPEELKKTHQRALDIFFLGEDERGSSERGPVIRSMSPGIVVAAAGDWVGGEGAGSYRRGGLTPRAGNGVIVYDPDARRYYTYFHLRSVDVRAGQIVSPGAALGQGGNTGANARRRGHGGHLHLEIYDAAASEALSCYELRSLLLSL